MSHRSNVDGKYYPVATNTSMSITVKCPVCGKLARRKLMIVVACHGRKEAPTEPARCPSGHGRMVRTDGVNDSWFHERKG